MPALLTIPAPMSTKVGPALSVRIFKRDSFACVYCGASGVDLTVDHVRPQAHYPATAPASVVNAPANLATACADCNHAKGPQDLQGFARMLRGRGVADADVRAMIARVRAALRRTA